MSEGLPYNGWPAHVRHGRDRHYYHAQRNALLGPADTCVGCAKPPHEYRFGYHAEEYGPTLEDYWASCVALCNPCHAMLHARFTTPNLWRLYLSQVKQGSVDSRLFPDPKHYVSLLSKLRSRNDVTPVPSASDRRGYLTELSDTEYAGAPKVATLLVRRLDRDEPIEVPDWLLYGSDLSLLNGAERAALKNRGISLNSFLDGTIPIERDRYGNPVYRRLYFKNQKVRPAQSKH